MRNYAYPSMALDTEISSSTVEGTEQVKLVQSDDASIKGLAYKPIFLAVGIYADANHAEKVNLRFENPSMTDFSAPHMRKLESILGVTVSCRQTGDESGEVNPVKVVVDANNIKEILRSLTTEGSEDPFCKAFNDVSSCRVFISCKMASEIEATVSKMLKLQKSLMRPSTTLGTRSPS